MPEPFIVQRRVRFGDCDPGGILYTPRISYFIVEAVLDFLTHRLGAPCERALLDMGIFPPARQLSVEFLKPMAWDETVQIQVNITKLGNTSIHYSVMGIDSHQDTAFTASLTQVCISAQTRQPVAIPETLRQVLIAE